METLPFIDDHTVVADASAEAVYAAALAAFDRPMSGIFGRYARLVGVKGDRPFVIARAEAPTLLALTGEHHFSRYALTFTIREVGAHRSELTAHTNAVFPGVAGEIYKTAVIRSRAHVLATRWLLRRIARSAAR